MTDATHTDIEKGNRVNDNGAPATPGEPLLVVDNLRTWFNDPHGQLRAVDGVSFKLRSRRDAR